MQVSLSVRMMECICVHAFKTFCISVYVHACVCVVCVCVCPACDVYV